MAAMGKRSRFSKRNKGYRQDADVADLIERAAKLAGVPEADLVDECILRHLRAVLSERFKRRALLRDKSAIAAMAAIFKPKK